MGNEGHSSNGAATAPAGPIKRGSRQRKKEAVLRLLRGESIEEWSREVDVEVYRLAKWRDRALAGIEAALKERAKDDPVQARAGWQAKRVAA